MSIVDDEPPGLKSGGKGGHAPTPNGRAEPENPWPPEVAEPLADWAMSQVVVRRDVYGAYRADGGTYTAHEPLTRDLLVRHFRGEVTIGAHSTSADNRCKCALFDIDAHTEADDPEVNWRCALAAADAFAVFGLNALVLDSNGKGGFHVRVFFKKPVPAVVARWLCDQVEAELKAAGFAAPESFPKQDELTIDRPYGNWTRIPGKNPRRPHWTRVYDPKTGTWHVGKAAALRLIAVAGDPVKALVDAHNAAKPKGPDPGKARPRDNRAGGGRGDKAEQARDALRFIPNSGLGVDYDSWIAVGMALAELHGDGRAIYHEWSTQSSKYDSALTDAKFDSFAPGEPGKTVTLGTLFKEAQRHGWDFPKPAPKTPRQNEGKSSDPQPAPGANGDGKPPDNSFNSFNSSPSDGQDEDDAEPLGPSAWVTPPDPLVYHGLAGEIVRAMEPTTESDPLALLVQLLLSFGSVVGRRPYYEVESTRHFANEFANCVGESSIARKGTSAERIKAMFSQIDSDWLRNRVVDGLSTGEGLLNAVRDPTYAKQPRKDKGRVVGYEDVMTDGGVSDKRLYVLESEFGGILRANEREGNRLSVYIRRFWDSGSSGSVTKSPTRATDAHVSIVGHITEDELRERLNGSDISNGFANRFLWFAVRRSKVLPFGGEGFDTTPFVARLKDSVEAARNVERVVMTHHARLLWASEYVRLTTAAPGKLGQVTNRAAPHTLRLALIYALLDGYGVIDEEHLAAALKLWDASFRCAAHIFGESLGDPRATKILDALRRAPDGLTRTEINATVFKRNEKGDRIKESLRLLIKHGLAVEVVDGKTGGRPKTVYKCNELNEKNEKSPTKQGQEAETPAPKPVRTDYEENEITPTPEDIETGVI